jgi:hypothetical protein
MREELESARHMRRLLYGQLLSRALCAAAALGLPDLLAGGPVSSEVLAQRTGTNEKALDQLLRSLCAFEIFRREPSGEYSVTPLGATLQSDAPGSALPTALLVGAEIGEAWNGLLGTVRTGVPSFEQVHGAPFFTYMDDQAQMRAVFDRSQSCDLQLALDQILTAVAFSDHATIVDVGGGDGALLGRILTAAPQTTGILFDLPGMVPSAEQILSASGHAGRYQVVGGDFFTQVPSGGDLYLLREILHDWDDARCLDILRTCRSAMKPDSRLLIIERTAAAELRTDPDAQLTALMDLYMMSVLRGEERTVADFERMLSAAELVPVGVTRLPGSVTLFEASL